MVTGDVFLDFNKLAWIVTIFVYFCRYKDDPTNIDEVELERAFGFKIADLRNKKIADAAKKEIDTKHGKSATFWKGTFYNKTDLEKKELQKGLEDTGTFV